MGDKLLTAISDLSLEFLFPIQALRVSSVGVSARSFSTTVARKGECSDAIGEIGLDCES